MERVTAREPRQGDISLGKVIESLGRVVRRLTDIEDILGEDYDLNLLKALLEANNSGCLATVVRCHDCVYHTEAEGSHYCKFWIMYCPDDSDFYCKAGRKNDGN